LRNNSRGIHCCGCRQGTGPVHYCVPCPPRGAEGFPESKHSRVGTLIVPLDLSLPEEDRPGWIIDGQQRIAAIREASIGKFPVCVVAFVTDDDQEQREQFILVNSTKRLPKGLIYELLRTTRAKLPIPRAVPPGPGASSRGLSLVRRLLGFRPWRTAEMERDSEYQPGHPTARERFGGNDLTVVSHCYSAQYSAQCPP
jgi:hypothetical protein